MTCFSGIIYHLIFCLVRSLPCFPSVTWPQQCWFAKAVLLSRRVSLVVGGILVDQPWYECRWHPDTRYAWKIYICQKFHIYFRYINWLCLTYTPAKSFKYFFLQIYTPFMLKYMYLPKVSYIWKHPDTRYAWNIYLSKVLYFFSKYIHPLCLKYMYICQKFWIYISNIFKPVMINVYTC